MLTLDGPVGIDGSPGWPPGRRPENPPFPDAWVYSFFVAPWNDFITVQGLRARLGWAGQATTE